MFIINYEKKHLNQAVTIQMIKEQLQFLSKNIWQLNHSDYLFVEDVNDLMEFLPYTKSVVRLKQQANANSLSSRVIDAMQKRQNALRYQQAKQMEQYRVMQLLMQAIQALPMKECRCITAKYIMHSSYQQIADELGISISTVGRVLRSAYLHLAQLLQLEYYDDQDEEKGLLTDKNG